MNVYISGPFFNKKERTNMEILKNYLKTNYPDNSYYFPMDFKVPDAYDLPNKDWAKTIFEEDMLKLKHTDLVIVVYYGQYSDSGTAFEVGYALSKKISIYVLVVDKQETQSLMVLNCTPYIWEFNQFIKTGDDLSFLLDLSQLEQN